MRGERHLAQRRECAAVAAVVVGQHEAIGTRLLHPGRVTDEQLATDIARKIGQEIIAIASTGGAKNAVNKFGVGNLSELLKQAEELIRYIW